MKSYLRLLLISVFFIFVLNVAQAEVSEGITQEEIPEEILEAHEAVWKLEVSHINENGTVVLNGPGTAFFIGPNQVVTNFHVISDGKNESYKSRSIENIYLKQGDKKINFTKVLYASAEDDLAILETEEEVSEYLNVSEEDPSGRLFALGYPHGIKQTLIHLEEYGVSDKGYDYKIVVNKVVFKGLSGGPVLDEKKEVIGIIYHGYENILRFIKVSKIEELRSGVIGRDCSDFSLSSCVEKAIENLKEEAERGYALAQYQLARMYLYGIGMEPDYKKAFYGMEKAAEQGYAPAQDTLARRYLGGTGVESYYRKDFYWRQQVEQLRRGLELSLEDVLDEAEAFYWMKKVAEQGDAPAQYELALMYFYGIGVDQDEEQALNWMEEAAEQGSAPAQYELALMYLHGRVVEQDEEQAFYWMSKAARQGYAKAKKMLFQMSHNRVLNATSP